MVTKITLFAVLCLLATAVVAQGRVLSHSAETSFESQLVTTAPTTKGMQQATVRQVIGVVRARKSENDPWQDVKVGQVFDEGVEFRTGIRSQVVFSVPPDQTIILDRLGVVKLLIAQRDGNEARTSLGMPYGRTEYQVEEAGLQHNADIASPGATLAVRGTKNMMLYDQGPFTPIAFASQPVRLRNEKGKTIAFGKAGARARVAADKNSPGEQQLVEQRIDPAGNFAARSQSENAVLNYLNRVAPNLDVSQFRLLSLITDPNFKGTGVGTLPIPGQLDFTLFWTTAFFSDLDLTVTDPSGAVVSFKNPTVKSGGTHTGNAIAKGGKGGAQAEEHVLWTKGYPQGKYTIRITQRSGSKGGSSVIMQLVRDPLSENSERLFLLQTKVSSQTPTITRTVTVGPRGSSSSASAGRRK